MKRQVYEGMKPFKKLFVRAMTDDDVTRLLDLKIRRISAYDIKKNRGEIDDIVAAIKAVQCEAEKPHQDHHRLAQSGSSRSTGSTSPGGP